MPETAFHDDERMTPESRSVGRFETRRIGPSSDSGERRSYRGARIDLDLKNAELAEVFRLLADVGRVNIVVASEVTGTVTLKLKNVPWDQALDVVVRAKGLDLERDGNVLLIRVARPIAP